MAIDISTDLNIVLLALNIETPTITGIYDAGSPPGTYLPGKDFSFTDNVSTGTTAQLNFSIAFDSISNQIYTLDKVYIQSVDDPRTDGKGQIPGRWINQNPDPTDITDDGMNTIIPNYNANMTSIVFDSSANIRSNSTVSTGISATLPAFGFWWKSKIMPKIQVVAEKDGIIKVSDPLQLPTILLSTAGKVVSTLGPAGNITYSNAGIQPGFSASLVITTNKDNLPNISRILDVPDYNLITYKINYAASVNSANIPLTPSNFTPLPVGNAEIVSFDYTAGVITLVVLKTDPGLTGARINVFIPFDASGMDNATVGINGTWNVVPPEITGFLNGYLFSQEAAGSASQTVVVDTSGQPPEQPPIIQENVFGALSNKIVGQTLNMQNYPCFRTQNSVVIRMIDSSISSFSSSLSPTYSFRDTDGNLISGNIPADSYTAFYGNYDFPLSYNPNTIAEQVLDGIIEVMPYDDLILSGKVPNILMVTITADLYAGHTVDYSGGINFQFTGGMNVLTQSEFAELYQTNPQNSYPTYLYSYMSLATCYSSAAQGYAEVGALLQNGGIPPTIDSFSERNGIVYLNLGTTTKEQPISVSRFNSTSFVRSFIPLSTLTSYIEYSITGNNEAPVNTVTDYTLTYCLLIRWTTVSGASVASNIPEGTELTVILPDNLIPFIYLAGSPYVIVPIGGIAMNIPITDYSISGNTLKLTTPIEMNMHPDKICVPVRFFIPSTDLTTSMTSLDFSKPLVYLQDPNSLIYGFTTDSLLFQVITVTRSLTLRGALIDTTGLTVSPTVYDRGQEVTYIATVYNQSYSPSSDYCLSMTVPTNEYNPVETSNNTLPAYITAINPVTPNTTVYFQTAANATPTDIFIMKTINRPDGPTLEEYFNNVIVNEWILYTGQTLPPGVVMLVGCTPDVPPENFVRIDYNAVVDIPAGDNTLYSNNAVFNYYSSGANLEAQSNMVSIYNHIAESIPISKEPFIQLYPLENGVTAVFDSYFNAPLDPLIFQTFTVTDALHPSLTLDEVNSNVKLFPDRDITFVLNYDPVTNIASFEIENSALIAGGILIIHIEATVTNAALIPIDPTFQAPMFNNTVELTVNHNPDLSSESTPVIVLFTVPLPEPVPIVKSPQNQFKPRENGVIVEFTLEFTAPDIIAIYNSFTITDTIHTALTLTASEVTVKAGLSDVLFNMNYDSLTGALSINFDNTPLTAGQLITVTLPAVLTDVTKLPVSNIIENTARLTLNNIPDIFSDSNTVTARFGDFERCQAITDLIQSIAMQQTGISHILNAEGEKLQLGISIAESAADLLLLNESVISLLASIEELENMLVQIIGLLNCGLCDMC